MALITLESSVADGKRVLTLAARRMDKGPRSMRALSIHKMKFPLLLSLLLGISVCSFLVCIASACTIPNETAQAASFSEEKLKEQGQTATARNTPVPAKNSDNGGGGAAAAQGSAPKVSYSDIGHVNAAKNNVRKQMPSRRKACSNRHRTDTRKF